MSPGPKRVLGTKDRVAGLEQGGADLNARATHPSTARFVATKLARHFIAEDPPPPAVDRMRAAMTYRPATAR